MFVCTGRSSGLLLLSWPSHPIDSGIADERNCEVYSYGDSTGFEPVSLLIPRTGTNYGANKRNLVDDRKGFLTVMAMMALMFFANVTLS